MAGDGGLWNHGNWIWKRALADRPDSFLFLRKRFSLEHPATEGHLLISANSAYLLMINDQVVGFGPRATGSDEYSNVDSYEIGYYLREGINTVGIIGYYTFRYENNGRLLHPAGVWCSFSVDDAIRCDTDETWEVYPADCFSAPRHRAGGLFSEFCDMRIVPRMWRSAGGGVEHWFHPDYIVPVGDYGTRLRRYPQGASTVNESVRFHRIGHGVLQEKANCSQIEFSRVCGGGNSVTAAEGYLFCACDCEMPVRFFADDSFRFFCNAEEVAVERSVNTGRPRVLSLKRGWNRLLAAQKPMRNSMGILLIFQDHTTVVRSQPDEDAPAGWLSDGPLRLPMCEFSGKMKLGHAERVLIPAGEEYLTDPGSFWQFSRLEITGKDEIQTLQEGDFLLLKLPRTIYGFPRLEIEAHAGDVVDVILFSELLSDKHPLPSQLRENTHTVICREGVNGMQTFHPHECLGALVAVRRASGKVNYGGLEVEELTAPLSSEAFFHCSNDDFNRLWETGRRVTRRAAAFVPRCDVMEEHNYSLIDCYMHSVNMMLVFGDYECSSALLREFLEGQLENGNIPKLTFSAHFVPQIGQLFILPVWLLHNYQIFGDEGILRRALPHLSQLEEYLNGRLDEHGLINFPLRFGAVADNPIYHHPRAILTASNALYCRFLLSAAEVHKCLGEEEAAELCMRRCRRTAKQLCDTNLDRESGFFAAASCDGELILPEDFLANFCTIYGGIASEEQIGNFLKKFFPTVTTALPECARHPYWYWLLLETLFGLGRHNEAFGILRRCWLRRLGGDSGAWRLADDEALLEKVDFSEGVTVSPNVFLIRDVAGVRIGRPGHELIFFCPGTQQAEGAETSFSTVRGRIHVKWFKTRSGELDVTIDSSYPLKVVPEMSPEMLATTTFRLGESVTLHNLVE
ncbi:MAG: hypothetical protein PHS41_05080 [Victivallaceae bacterium]|nr:hypothetical protein [Victivallaceae bacterium]